MVNIVYNASGHFCGGTFIDKNFVLTFCYYLQNYSSLMKYDDIGLIQLAEDVNYDGNIYPACLHTDASELFNNTELVVTGLGRTEKYREFSFGDKSSKNTCKSIIFALNLMFYLAQLE